MRIGAVAKAVGISSSAIRYYERRGLISPVGRVAGRREFDDQSILTLRFLKLAQTAGFTLIETRQLLDMGFGNARKQSDWLAFLRGKRKVLRVQIKEVRRMDTLLEKFERCTCPSLADCMADPGDSANLKRRT
ncbi:MAG: MerR family transcriptional regulator [Rhodobacteraceae bacterium]|nr:MerR family transcriptional regulator [Paracoccaceae bacterium]